MLRGHLPFSIHEIDENARLLLNHFRCSTQLDIIVPRITEDDWVAKIKKWREETTTSPSGMHLGHHKALCTPIFVPTPKNSPGTNTTDTVEPTVEDKRVELLQCQLQLLNYAIDHCHSFARWQRVENVMLLKEPGNFKVHRLQVIHIYEADLKLLLAVMGRKVTHHAIDKSLLTQWQYGSLPGRDSLTPPFIEETAREAYTSP